jgi:hypothetical protein
LQTKLVGTCLDPKSRAPQPVFTSERALGAVPSFDLIPGRVQSPLGMTGAKPHLFSMILTTIPREHLGKVLDRFMARLEDPFSRAVFRPIQATSADRAVGAAAERHRRAAVSLARSLGMAVYPEGARCAFNWDGRALDSATEAYVILHEAAHFVLAPSERRRLIDFGLGPGPDTRDRDAAARAAVLSPLAREEDEAAASLLGIIWEAQLGHPALASFLDQNWLEGLEHAAPSHFTRVVGELQRRGLLDLKLPAVFDRAAMHRTGRVAAARTAEPGCPPDPFAEARGEAAQSGLLRRPATPASIRRSFGMFESPSLIRKPISDRWFCRSSIRTSGPTAG